MQSWYAVVFRVWEVVKVVVEGVGVGRRQPWAGKPHVSHPGKAADAS
jgi:hypothetical protein